MGRKPFIAFPGCGHDFFNTSIALKKVSIIFWERETTQQEEMSGTKPSWDSFYMHFG